MQVTFGEKEAFHHPSFYWCGVRYVFLYVTVVTFINAIPGLILVPNGKALGKFMGDKYYHGNLEPPVGRNFLDESNDYWSNEQGSELYEEENAQLEETRTYNMTSASSSVPLSS